MNDKPTVTGKPRHRTRLSAAERRETILRAATDVFAQSGYRAAKVSDVAAQIGVTEPVIFQNFGSKAALFTAVLERAVVDARLAMDGHGSAAGLLHHVLSGHDGGAHPGAAYGILFADAITLTADPKLAEPARDALRAIAGHLADLIRHAQASGAVRADTDPGAAAWLLLSLLSARRLREAAMPSGLEQTVTALALRALAPLLVQRVLSRPRRRRQRGRRPSTA
jgi:AcrR family transcriptional regulator